MPVWLNLNEVPYPPSPAIANSVQKMIYESNRYPKLSLYKELRNLLATYSNVDPQNIIIDAGAMALIHLAFVCTKKKEGRVITYRPTFHYPLNYAKNLGMKVYTVNLDDEFNLDITKLLDLKPKPNDVIMIVNPNNPTGNLVIRSLNEIKELLETGALVIHDEVYHEFSNFTCKNLIKDYDNLLIIRTLSKAFALAGFRVGYGLGSEKLINNLRALQQFYALPTVSVVAAIAALNDLNYMKNIVEKVKKSKKKLEEMIVSIKGVHVNESLTNFLLLTFKELNILAKDIYQYLKSKEIYVTYYPNEEKLRYSIRVTVGTDEENQAFVKALHEFISRKEV